MLVLDVTVPSGRFTAAERRELARRLTATELLGREGAGGARADAGVLALYESLTHVRIVEHDVWITDGEQLNETDQARYVVDVRVGAWGKEMAGHLIKGVTRAIEAFEGAPAARLGGHAYWCTFSRCPTAPTVRSVSHCRTTVSRI